MRSSALWIVVVQLQQLFSLPAVMAQKTPACRGDEKPYRGDCYHFVTLGKMWQSAEDYCVARDAHLASFHSAADVRFLTGHARGTHLWTGLRTRTHRFTDRTTVAFVPWAPDEPRGGKKRGCVLLLEGDLIRDERCDYGYPFACKRVPSPLTAAKEKRPQSTGRMSGGCGSWVENPFNGFCYLLGTVRETWPKAQQNCEAENGNLLSVADAGELDFARGLANGTESGALWMGGSLPGNRGQWEWSDRTTFAFLRWSTATTRSYSGGRCLSFAADGDRWYEDDCERKRSYVCKREKTCIS
ncbi:macrophage mannose receptor 1-like isoform X2 [Corythoichthys intestinalis]|uniref:macrophage mannose receptor 1-like isoform X2 n=1 Tax=Corythoichthys intestinalis TaxID=161448 RepID=UPI0025A61348|nr:macrophage mannose receptor 1-like isoform X2 [Corythoichthys intestinalis]